MIPIADVASVVNSYLRARYNAQAASVCASSITLFLIFS
jgi:hypothetical protein